MFSQQVNTPCNNKTFSSRTIHLMAKQSSKHSSMARLFDCAREHGDMAAAVIATRMGVSAQTIQNWIERGLSRDGALTAQRVYGCDANWLLGKGGSRRPGESVTEEPAAYTYIAPLRSQRVKLRGNAIVNKEGFWTDLSETKDDEYIEVVMDDPDAYAIRIIGRRYYPAIDSGQCIVVSPAAAIKINKRVLVRLADGRHAVRIYLSHEDGLWIFASLTDPAELLELRDNEVLDVHRITAIADTD